jgi:hypothetical protein
MMEGFIINIIATVGFSGIFLVVFFSIYYLYLKGNEGKIRDKDKDKRLEKRIMK